MPLSGCCKQIRNIVAKMPHCGTPAPAGVLFSVDIEARSQRFNWRSRISPASSCAFNARIHPAVHNEGKRSANIVSPPSFG
jgi:hypothetical protein